VAKETCVPKKDNLLRFMESSMFQAPLAISYLFTTKELGVQTYIANKLFTFPEHEVDFYLPQLISMYIHIPELASLIYPYLKHRYVFDSSFKCDIDHKNNFQMHQECWILTPGGLAFRIILIRRPHYKQKEEWWLVIFTKIIQDYLLLNLILGTKLKTLILSDKLRPKSFHEREIVRNALTAPSPNKKAHQRSQSDASALIVGQATAAEGGLKHFHAKKVT
jgi:phosphatidylinositol 4-kinase B